MSIITESHRQTKSTDELLDQMFRDTDWEIKVPDAVQDLRKYGNIVEWVVNGLGLDTFYDHVRQYQTIRDFYELLCPECSEDLDYDCWGKRPSELKEQILLRLDWDKEIFVCPVCGYTLNRLRYENLIACVGMRAGKTVLGAIIGSYTTMMWFALGGSLEDRFNLIPGQRLRISMVSTASSQTEKTVWAAYAALLVNAQDMNMKDMLHNGLQVDVSGKEKSITKRLTKEALQNIKEWRYGNLEVLSLHSNSGSLAGGTGLLVILEEFSRFDIGESKRSAGEVHAVLDRSLKTIRNLKKSAVDDLFGRKIIISSPYYVDDIDPTLQEIKNAGSSTLAIHLPTWEFNPFMPRSSFDEDYRRDFWKAERDYGANPRGGKEVFFENEDAVVKCIESGEGMKFYQTTEYKGQLKFITSTVDAFTDRSAEYAVHVDLSVKHDIMSMAFSKREDDRIVVSGLMVLVPFGGLSLWLDTPLDIILGFSKQMKIKLVTYDNWQSVSAIQRLGVEGIVSRRRSIGEAALIEFKKLAYLEKIKVIDTGTGVVEKLVEEIKTVRRIDGKLTHVDVLMSVAGSVTNWTLGEVDKKNKSDRGILGKVSSAKVFRFNRWS